MKRISLIIALTFLSSQLYADTFKAKVMRVLDGDTIAVVKDKDPEEIKVRLVFVDCPEKTQEYGQEAKQYTYRATNSKMVTIKSEKTDRYGRTLGEVILPDGSSLNKKLIETGSCWHYSQYDKNPDLDKMEKNAKAKRLGLWSESNPTPPWEYRHSKKVKHPEFFEQTDLNYPESRK